MNLKTSLQRYGGFEKLQVLLKLFNNKLILN